MAREVELITGFFDAEQRSTERWDTAAFNAHGQTYVAAGKYSGKINRPVLSDDAIACVRAVRDALLQRWFALAPGDALELDFSRDVVRA